MHITYTMPRTYTQTRGIMYTYVYAYTYMRERVRGVLRRVFARLEVRSTR